MRYHLSGSAVRAPHHPKPAPPPRRAKPPPAKIRLTAFRVKKAGGPRPLPIGRMRITGGQAHHQGAGVLPLLPGPRVRATVPHPPKGPVSPYINPFRFGGVTGTRIDQGVDYSARPGTRIGALGPGRIVEALSSGSGWPGGGFIAEQLSKGPARGQVVYTAEDVAPGVVTGQRVKAGQVIGKFTAGGSIESGWGTRPPNVGQALAYGKQSAPGPDPGAFSTGYGIAFDRLIRALGGPRGVLQSTISGSAPPEFSATGGRAGMPAPARGRVSLPVAPPAVVVPSGVHPSGGGGGAGGGGGGGVRLMAAEAVSLHPRKRPEPWPVDPHRKPRPPVPPPGPVTMPPSVTTIFSSKGRGGVTAPPPPTAAASSGSGTTLLLVAGAGVVLLFVLMRKKKGGKK